MRHSIHAACKLLAALGGPDILEEALAVLQDQVVVIDDSKLTGKYGAHSEPSRAAARLWDETSSISSLSGAAAPGLWLCGHFTAKAMAALAHDLCSEEHGGKSMLLWQVGSVPFDSLYPVASVEGALTDCGRRPSLQSSLEGRPTSGSRCRGCLKL